MLEQPVIIGAGEVIDRPSDPMEGREPLRLMADALLACDESLGGGWLGGIDSIDVVNSITWGYADLPAQLCRLLGIDPARKAYGVIGGETPVRYIHDAAIRIARGESQVAIICGGEAAHTLRSAEQHGVRLPWTPQPAPPSRPIRDGVLHDIAIRNGLIRPLVVYPIYEYGSRAAWDQTADEGQAESAALWSEFSKVAARNPYAWFGRAIAAEDIATPSASNRRVAGPYTKWMVANPTVNQSAAILVTSASAARAAGVPEDRWMYVWGGAAAMEPRDFVSRDQYERSDAMSCVLESAAELAGRNGASFDHAELYSCFPCVPKMARRVLHLDGGIVPTVAGSLTFFGAPLNNYMSHATAAMARRLGESGGTGLLFGQGEFVTKHHAMVVSNRPAREPLGIEYSVQVEADRRRGPVPAIDLEFEGAAVVETFTMSFDREGEADFGVVFARNEAGARVVGRVTREDRDTLRELASERTMIGAPGRMCAGEGLPRWSF